MMAEASTVIFPKEREQLPPPTGEMEKNVLLSGVVLKKDYLKAQLYDIVKEYADSLRMSNGPEDIQNPLNKTLDWFVGETYHRMTQQVQQGLTQNCSADAMVQGLIREFEAQTKRIRRTVEESYRKRSWYMLLSYLDEKGCEQFVFENHETDETCPECSGQKGKVYTFGQLKEEGLIPPLHPNCRCEIVPVEGEWMKNLQEWYEPILRIPQDAQEMIEAITLWRYQTSISDSIWEQLDGLTLGIFSGIWNGYVRRHNEMMADPNWYTIGNAVTSGLFELVKNVFFPEEAW